ncbi:2Fe-2S iron-sulfur cluster binding domain-containing protein [Natronoglomus mannanivorans]
MSDYSNLDSDRSLDGSDTMDTELRTFPDTERRRLLAAMGSAGAVVLAGCLDDENDTDEDGDGEEISHVVAFLEQDERIEVDAPEDEALLYPALDAGVDIPYSCEAGRCGECTVKYDGDANEVVSHDGNEYLDDDQIEDGWVLTCVAYPSDDSELEVAHPDDT